MKLIDEVKERLSLFKDFYDTVRIVDPIEKKASVVTEKEIVHLNSSCYALLRKDTICENCISMRAGLNSNTFVKIEYDKERVFLVIATPVENDGRTYIVEILKDITENSTVSHKLTEESTVIEDVISSLNERAVKDELTCTYNKRYINERLPVDIKQSILHKRPLSVIMADIDFFKKVNDTYGHIIGDKILRDFADLVSSSIRKSFDWVGRYGGEEFLIVLNNTGVEEAYSFAEKIRKEIEEATFRYNEIRINITSSFGVYSFTDRNILVEELLSKADRNLYQAKAGGRNKTIASEGNSEGDNLVFSSAKELKLSKLREQINELRNALNEVCCTIENGKTNQERLQVSQSLDELIVEYMKGLDD